MCAHLGSSETKFCFADCFDCCSEGVANILAGNVGHVSELVHEYVYWCGVCCGFDLAETTYYGGGGSDWAEDMVGSAELRDSLHPLAVLLFNESDGFEVGIG